MARRNDMTPYRRMLHGKRLEMIEILDLIGAYILKAEQSLKLEISSTKDGTCKIMLAEPECKALTDLLGPEGVKRVILKEPEETKTLQTKVKWFKCTVPGEFVHTVLAWNKLSNSVTFETFVQETWGPKNG